MKEYTITLTEAEVKRVIWALQAREGHFRRLAREKDNRFPEIDIEFADGYKQLFEMFKAL